MFIRRINDSGRGLRAHDITYGTDDVALACRSMRRGQFDHAKLGAYGCTSWPGSTYLQVETSRCDK